jgi:hypothetical protein
MKDYFVCPFPEEYMALTRDESLEGVYLLELQ